VPALPGALSALGILVSDVVKDYSRTVLWRVSGKLPLARLDREFSTLQKQAAKDIREEAWQGRAHYQRNVDIRYRSQGYELNLPFTRNLSKEFEREHQRRYGYAHAGRELEFVTLRLRATVKSPTGYLGNTGHLETGTLASLPRAKPRGPGRATLGSLPASKAEVLFDGKKWSTMIYSREELKRGKTYFGPSIVTEYSATTVIPPGKRFYVDNRGNLLIAV